MTASALGNSPADARATPDASTTWPSRFAPQLLFGMLQTHLGVRFVSERDQPRPAQRRPGRRRTARRDRRRGFAARSRLATSATIQELARRPHAGRRAPRPPSASASTGWSTNFDFDGLSELADSLRLIGVRDVTVGTQQAPQILLVDDNPTNLQVLYQTLDGQRLSPARREERQGRDRRSPSAPCPT